MKLGLFKCLCLVVVMGISSGACTGFAKGNNFMNAVVTEESILLADSSPESSQLGFLEKGDGLSVFPEMSTENYFFVMAKTGTCEDSYGWIPSRTVMFSDEKFADVPRNHWAREAISNLEDEGIMKGSEGYFHGSQTVSRYELATVLDRHLKKFQAYKSAIQQSLEAMPVNKTLSDSEASRMSRLIRHLEGIELTENSLKSSYAKLEKRINNNEQRIDVVEETSVNNGQLIAKVQTQVNEQSRNISKMNRDFSKVNIMEKDIQEIFHRLHSLNASESSVNETSSFYEKQQKEMLKQIDILSERIRNLESSKGVVMAQADVSTEIDNEITGDEFAFEGFDEPEDEEAFQESFECVDCEVDLNNTVSQAHSALKEALNKGLKITRHPLDDTNNQTLIEHTPSEPNRVLVRALTKQIAEISDSLNSVGTRIEDIERGVL